MIDAAYFKGFPKETADFLFELKLHNTLSEQEENLKKYKILISEPLKLLYEELLPTVNTISQRFETNPGRCISTPYTDRRFSPSVPLKEYMYIRFKYTCLQENIPGLYFDMGSEYYSYGLRVYKQNIKGMDKLREKIADLPEKFSEVLDKLYGQGFSLIGESYKKDKIPALYDCSAKKLYNMKSFYIGKNIEVNKDVFSKNLAEEIKDGFIAAGEFIKLI